MSGGSMSGAERPSGRGEFASDLTEGSMEGSYEAPVTGSAEMTDSSTGAAKEQAAAVGQSAKESGQQVAEKAAGEAKDVAAEARRQVKDMSRQVGDQAQQQAAMQKDKAAGGLHSLSQQLRSMAEGGGSGAGPAADLAHQAAEKFAELATWLEGRDPGELVEELRGIARRKPGTFLLGAAAAGVVAGRLTRGVVQAKMDEENQGSGYQVSSGSADWSQPVGGMPGPGVGTEWATDQPAVMGAESGLTGSDRAPGTGYESAGRV